MAAIPISRSAAPRALSETLALLAGLALLFAGYVLAFATTLDQPLARSVWNAGINTLAAGLAGLLFQPLVTRLAMGRLTARAALMHPLLAAGFAVSWYFCTLTGYGLTEGWAYRGLRLDPFGPAALSWQMFQGATVYSMLALFAHWRAAVRALDRQNEAPVVGAEPDPGPQRAGETLLIRCDREVARVAVSEIVRIAGADGYAEVFTRTRRLLSVSSLARFEAMLPPDRFVRVHRSHILRLSAVEHAEPAGNARLLLHLEDGARIMTSRAGAQRLRALTV